MQKTGLYHLLAISGAHIGMISALLFALFRALRVPRRASFLALIVLLVLYALLVEGRASVLRAVLMSVGILLAKLLEKDAALLNTAGDRLVAACESCHKAFKPDLPTMGLYKSPNYPRKSE